MVVTRGIALTERAQGGMAQVEMTGEVTAKTAATANQTAEVTAAVVKIVLKPARSNLSEQPSSTTNSSGSAPP